MPSVVPSGQALTSGIAGTLHTFQIRVSDDIDVRKLYFGMRGPVRPELWTKNLRGGLLEVSYRVGRAGKYTVFIEYDGKHVAGSPWKLTVR